MSDGAELLPPIPVFNAEMVRECTETRRALRMVFEWYRYAAMIAVTTASILPEAPGLRLLPRRSYFSLTGLLLRCSQLMRSSLELVAKQRFGDSLRILARSASESAVKILWLCHHGKDSTFQRYIADGLKADLEFRDHVRKNVAERGHALVIEQRMIESVDRFVGMSGLTEDEIRAARNLPDVIAMYEDVGGGRELYVVVQKFGSHAAHGTWLELALNYLTDTNGEVGLNYDYVPPDEDGLRMTALLVLDAVLRFLNFTHPPSDVADYLRSRAEQAQAGLLETHKISYRGDFDAA